MTYHKPENKAILLNQLNAKMKNFSSLLQSPAPSVGWVKAIRAALKMSAHQLGSKLGITRQGVIDMEKREQEGAITLKTLREVAKVMDMQLVYGFVPNDGSLEQLIERKARAIATSVVMRASATMALEGQENSKERILAAIEERTLELKKQIPGILWE